MTDNYGVQIGLGITEETNLRLRYEKISPVGSDDDGEGYNFIAIEPKFAITKDRVAGSLPVGFFSGSGNETSDTWQVHPSLHMTMPITNGIEINVSPKYLIFIKEGLDNLVAFNVGLGISSNMSKWVLRPEIGYLLNPGEEGYFFSWSLGFSFIP